MCQRRQSTIVLGIGITKKNQQWWFKQTASEKTKLLSALLISTSSPTDRLRATSFPQDRSLLPFKSLECCTCYWLFCLWVNGGVIWWYKSQSPTKCTQCQNSALRRRTFDPEMFCQQNFQRLSKWPPHFCNRTCKCGDGGNNLGNQPLEVWPISSLGECPRFHLSNCLRPYSFLSFFTASIYCWLLNNFISPPATHTALFTARPLS